MNYGQISKLLQVGGNLQSTFSTRKFDKKNFKSFVVKFLKIIRCSDRNSFKNNFFTVYLHVFHVRVYYVYPSKLYQSDQY